MDVRDRDVELSELKIAAAELQHAAKQERDRAAEAESYYQQKLAALREEAEAVRWKKEDEVRAQRDEFEAHKREAQRQLHEARGARARGGGRAAAFDDAGRQREREHAAAVDEALARVGAAEAAARARREGQLAHARAQEAGGERARRRDWRRAYWPPRARRRRCASILRAARGRQAARIDALERARESAG